MHLLEDSTTYQEIFQKGVRQGQINGRKIVLLQQGTRKFGKPSVEQLERLNRLNSTESLDHLADRFFEASSWVDLLAGL